MRLVVNGSFLARPQTGLQRVARSLLQGVRAAGADLEVIAPPGATDPLVDRTAGPVPGGHRIWEQTVLPAAARGRPVLSLTNTAPLAGRNFVLVHDLAPLAGPQWFVPSMRVYGELVLRAARRAEVVLTVSAAVAGELAAAGVRNPVAVVRPAVGAGFVAPPDTEVSAMLARLGVTAPYTVLVGWADPRKDAVTAVAAHARAAATVPHELVLVGGRSRVFAPVPAPRRPGVRRLGFVPDAELRAVLAGAAALVYPSRYEGFGLPPLEAWQCGTPALVSDLPAVREATQGRAVYLPPGDVDAWAEAMVRALRGETAAPQPIAWSWADAAGQLLAALPAGC